MLRDRPNQPITSESLLYWTEVLAGFERDRVNRAREDVAGWSFEHVSAEMLEDSVGAAFAATLLVEAVEKVD